MLIEENEVTAVNLAVELERAVIQHVLEEDESIYVNEDGLFPFWVRIHKGAGFVSFKTHTNFKKSASYVQRLELCNELNMKNYMITANVHDDRLWFDYVLIYRDGLLRETFVRGCRQFARNVEKGLEQVDPENDFVLPPGKTESEDEKGGA
jgi:Putative bacterial sensory transduction regulator